MFSQRHRYASVLLALAIVALGPGVSATAATPPELPRSYVDTTYVPPTGTVLFVPAGGDLQAALTAAQPGDVVELQAGASWRGSFGLPNKTGSGWIIVRSSAAAQLPPAGTRVGPEHAPLMARIVAASNNYAIWTAEAAHHYRFIGIEVTGEAPLPAGVVNGGLIVVDAEGGNLLSGNILQTSLSQVPHHVIFDRCYVHAPAGGAEFIRGLIFDGAHTAVIDSYVSGFVSRTNDTQAVWGFNGPGPFKIVNNYLEAAGETIMFGGGAARIPNLVPSDIEIRQNDFKKLLAWRPGDPSYAGTPWLVKNHLEFKNGQRALVEGNLFEDHWAGGQSGFFLMLTPRVESGANPWAVASDITVRHNWVRRTTAGIAASGHDWPASTFVTSARVAIVNNVFEDLGIYVVPGAFNGVVVMPTNGIQDLVIEHNTIFNTYTPVFFTGGVTNGVMTGFVFQNNILHGGGYGILGDGIGNGLLALNGYTPGWTFDGNALVGPWPNETGLMPTYPAGSWPTGNLFPNGFSDVGFLDLPNGDYHLTAASPYKNAGSDGTDPGADIDALEAAYGGAGDPPAPSPAPAATTTTISAPSVTYGANATITVTASASTGTPTGTVSLVVDGGAAVGAALSSGQARFTLVGLTAGGHSLGASYAAQGGYAAGAATGTLQVTAASTATAISAAAVTAPANALVTVTVSSSAGTPAGTVSLVVDGGAALSASLSSGQAQFTLTSPSAGTHTLSATYAAQPNLGSSGATSTLQVNPSATGGTDVDPLFFSRATYSAKESSAKATITVLRSGPTGGTVSVQYATSDGTARAGVDYVATSGTLTFTPGVTQRTFSVKPINNSIGDGNRTVNLTLSNPGGGALLGAPTTAVLVIVNDDVAGSVRFQNSSYAVRASGGSITIQVHRDAGNAGGVTVNYATSNGTAVAGVDYVATSGTLTFGAGVNDKTFTISLINNGGGNRTVTLTLNNPGGGAVLGSPSTAVLTIQP